MSYNLESEVSKALENLLKTETDYNVIIHIGETSNFKEFHAHRIILCCRSEYFNKILSDSNIEKKDGNYIIRKPNITPQVFDFILKYLYTGHVNITNKTEVELLNIMITSDDLKLEKLTKLTEDYIIERHQQFLRNDPVEILRIIYDRELFIKLRNLCLKEVCLEPEILFNSDKFINLPAPLLEDILKRDDLNLIEIKIWENLIKWGLAQGQKLNRDISKWNQDEISTFKRILYKFIPLIRFYGISSKDYFNKVKPYEVILSKELRDDILKFHMVPTTLNIYKPRFGNSIIINQKHIALFANWINAMNKNTISYKFNLIYRASRDGNTNAAFHNKCDDKGAILVVTKIKNSVQIIGGYNSIGWNSINSYVFFFTDGMDIKTAKVGYCVYKSLVHKVTIKIFGDRRDGGTRSSHSYCYPKIGIPETHPYFYPNIGMPEDFIVDDCEVFQVNQIIRE
ncbi:hypothetical protein C1645_807548 [Glomus cerebriforme]|uniref:BTB/POZ domain-containing protein n=1 Tax=Glomus cerebriforme TaxID=658196 RepID=A0A397SSD2_9GLOM|nr:hypothetical protein C1645_807548 [Glomus cerebriforme]